MSEGARSLQTGRFLRRAARFIVFAFFLTVVVLPVVVGGVRTWFILRPGCGDYGGTPAKYGLDYQDIRIPFRSGVVLRGFFVQGKNNALILVPPAYGSGRDGLLDETTPYAKHGFSLLTWEARSCVGEAVTLGLKESEDVGEVLDYIARNPDKIAFPEGPIGIHGFSAGGATATLAAAKYPRIAALLTEGNFSTWEMITGLSYGSTWLEWLMGLGGHIAYRLSTGRTATDLNPLAEITKVPPRPIALFFGSEEATLPGARQMLSVVKATDPDANIDLWVLPGADHGFYVNVVGVENYAKRSTAFFDCALLKMQTRCDDWHRSAQQSN